MSCFDSRCATQGCQKGELCRAWTRPEPSYTVEGLLRRAEKQLQRWAEKYGAWQPQWLPPAGDVCLSEDIAEYLASSALAQPPAGWVMVPVEPTAEMYEPERRFDEGQLNMNHLRPALKDAIAAAPVPEGTK